MASHSPLCTWPTPQYLVAYFGGGARLEPYTILTLRAGLIAADEVAVNVLPALNPIVPSVVLSVRDSTATNPLRCDAQAHTPDRVSFVRV